MTNVSNTFRTSGGWISKGRYVYEVAFQARGRKIRALAMRIITKKDMLLDGKTSSEIAKIIRKKLHGAYKNKLLKWIDDAVWFGPIYVLMTSIDVSDRAKWDAVDRTDKIKKMADEMQRGIDEPIILVQNDILLTILDGHTHFVARESIHGKEIQAFVGRVASDDWKKMKELEKSGEKGGKR